MLTICVHRLTCSDKNWSPASKSANSKPPLALPILRYSWCAYHPNLATLSPPAFVLDLRAPAAADPSPLRSFTFARPLANRSLPQPCSTRLTARVPGTSSPPEPWLLLRPGNRRTARGRRRSLALPTRFSTLHTHTTSARPGCVVMDYVLDDDDETAERDAASRRTGTGQTSSRRCPSTSAPISSRSTAARTSLTDHYTWCVRPSSPSSLLCVAFAVAAAAVLRSTPTAHA